MKNSYNKTYMFYLNEIYIYIYIYIYDNMKIYFDNMKKR